MANDEERIARKLRREYESALAHLSNVVSISSSSRPLYLTENFLDKYQPK